MSLNPQEVYGCGTGCPRTLVRANDADPWNGFEDWKLYDDLAWKTLKKVVDSIFDADTAGRLDLVQDVYRLSFRILKMQSHFPSDEIALNALRSELYFRAEYLCESDDHGLGIDHSEEILEDEVEQAECQVDYDRIALLADWRSLDKFVSVKEDLIKIIEDVYGDSYQRLARPELDEDFVLFEFRRMLAREMAEVRGAEHYLEINSQPSPQQQ
jgi:hypothetical protein